jgi:SAM-dependent methyltransferase
VLHVRQNPGATVVMDLGAQPPPSLEASFDCIILTQTLQFVFDVQTAVGNLWHLLKPGGVVLATFPGISQLSRGDLEQFGECWRFTTDSATRLFAEVFPTETLTVESHGNVLAAVGMLHGLAVEDLNVKDLEVHDPDYEVIVAVRAVKTG